MNAHIPRDLVPLPSMPWDVRPDDLPLNIEEVRTALWRTRGNITKAAELIKVSSNRLRTFVKKSPFLSAEQAEAQEQILDIAEDVVYEALTDTEDKGRKDAMARFVLLGPGKSRGYGSGAPKVTVNNAKGGTVVVGWADGTMFQPEQSGPVIEHE